MTTAVSPHYPELLPFRTATVAQTARIRSRIKCSDPLARLLRELAFGPCADDGFPVPTIPTRSVHG